MSTFFLHWRDSLAGAFLWLEGLRARTRGFYAKAFCLFVAVDFFCYWVALTTAYPQILFSYKSEEYVLMSLPVAGLAAVFDTLSLVLTLFIVRRALSSRHNLAYVAYLGADVAVAALATFWVLFAFVTAGWLVDLVLVRPETFEYRTHLYEGRFWSALHNPLGRDNIRNIYFGIIMGTSSILPTLLPLGLGLLSLMRSLGAQLKRPRR